MSRFKNLNINLFFRFLPFGIIALFTWYLISHWQRISLLFRFSYMTVAGVVLLTFASIIALSLQNLLLYHRFQIKLGFKESLNLTLLTTLGNLFPLSMGIFVKGLYLKKQHQMDLKHYFPSLVSLFVCMIGVNGLMGLAGLAWLRATGQSQGLSVLWIAFGLLSCTFLLIWLPLNRLPWPKRLRRQLNVIDEGWRTLSRAPLLVLYQSIIQALCVASFAGRFYLVFKALSFDILYVHCILFSAATIITRLLNIVPGGIGVREGIVAVLGGTLGFDFGVSAVAAGLDRLVGICINAILWLIFGYRLSVGNPKNQPHSKPQSVGENSVDLNSGEITNRRNEG